MTECPSCHAPAPLAGSVCHYCGADIDAGSTDRQGTAGGELPDSQAAVRGDVAGSSLLVEAEVPSQDGRARRSLRRGGRRRGPLQGAVDGEVSDGHGAGGEVQDSRGALGAEDVDSQGAVGAAIPDSQGAVGGDDLGLQEAVSGDPPPAQEARRVRGWAVPLVAGAIVVGIGYPLTALAVSQANRLPVISGDEPASELGGAGPGSGALGPKGRAQLSGALTYDGPATPLGCNVGVPKVITLASGTDQFSILVSVPEGAIPGAYKVEGAATFVAVSRLVGGTQTWTSIARTNATGQVTVNADRSVSAVFSGLEPSSGGAEGTIDGTVEVHCG